MLSTPLPQDTATPAALPAFVLQLLDDAVQNVSAASLRPLYLTIKGVGTSLLGVLPPRKLMHLQTELITILRNLDHSANLHCLAIFATLCAGNQCQHGAENALSSQDSESCMGSAVAQTEDIYQPARQFFGAKKACKTLDLVILRAIQSCSSASKMGPAQAIETLQLAREILQAVEHSEKVLWVQKNAAKIRKLYDKVRPSEVDLGVRLAAFELTGSLTNFTSIPTDVIAAVEKLFQRPLTTHSVEGIMQAYAGRFSDKFTVLQFTRALGAATECDRSDMAAVAELSGLRTWVQCLMETAKSSSLFRQTLLVAISSNKLQQPFQQFLTCKMPDAVSVTRHELQIVCPVQIKESRQGLQREICHLLLRSAFFTASAEVRLDPSVATALLDKLTEARLSSNSCQAFGSRPKPRPSVPSIFEVSNTPTMYRSDGDWRTVLKDDLDRDSAYRHGLIIRGIDSVCRDLEARCNEVEKPLNDERERSKCLQSELDHCKERCVRLEGEAEERNLVLDSLQAEQSHLLVQRQMAEQSTREVIEALEEARAQLGLAYKEAANAAHISGEELSRLELVHSATIVAKDELIEAGKEKCSSLESKLDHLHEQLACARQEGSDTKARLARTLGTVTERDAKVVDLQRIIQKCKDDLDQQTSIARQASGEVQSLKQEMASLRSEADGKRAEHERVVLKLNMATSESQERFEHELGALKVEMSQRVSQYEEIIATLREGSDRTMDEKVRLTEEYEVKTADLMHKIEKLNKERDMRAKEFAEAQDLSSKLMALMGKKPSQSSAPTAGSSPSSKQSRRRPAIAAISNQENIRSGPQPSWGSRGSNASGSTPKRLRLRRGSQAPSRHQGMMATGHKMVSGFLDESGTEIRQPLEELDHNVHHEAAVFSEQQLKEIIHGAEPDQINTAMPLEENERWQTTCDTSFGESYVFTSTDHRKLSSQDFEGGPGVYDETTGDL
ncbi:hypothetical protein MMC30_003016 [Trapelia coarctata]|nr:hypothetical protein [Trapelia coarctata]